LSIKKFLYLNILHPPIVTSPLSIQPEGILYIGYIQTKRAYCLTNGGYL